MGALTVILFYSDGTPAKGYKVSGVVSGMLGGMVSGGNTDKDGRYVLQWSSNSPLAGIFINGKKHQGTYRAGGTYTFNL